MSGTRNLKKNIGAADRFIRTVLAAISFYCIDSVSGTAQLVLGVVGIALVITALNGFSFLYLLFDFCTAKKEAESL